MQKVIYEEPVKYNFVKDITKIYEFCSDPTGKYNKPKLFVDNTISNNLKPIIDMLEGEKGFNRQFNYFKYVNRDTKLGVKLDKQKAILCFSGGKDSLCTALKLKDKYNLTLFYMYGINKSYPDEISSAKKCAELLGLPIIIVKVKVNGKTLFADNPVKNLLLYANALNYGLDNGIKNYFFGSITQNDLEHSDFDKNFSDSMEILDLYTNYINQTYGTKISNFSVLNKYTDSIIEFAKHKEFWGVAKSCLTPIRYRNNLHILNQQKYGVEVNNNNCGSCWKCCAEYVICCDVGSLAVNEGFYMHCLQVLKTKVNEIINNINPANYVELYKGIFGNDLFKTSYLNTLVKAGKYTIDN